jgi:hypothetical protein
VSLEYIGARLGGCPGPAQEQGTNSHRLAKPADHGSRRAAVVQRRGAKYRRDVGRASSGLTDVDLDWPEARVTACCFLPPTAVFGRASSPGAHWLYVTELAATETEAAIKFPFAADGCKPDVLELRIGAGGAAQTIFPGFRSSKRRGDHVGGKAAAGKNCRRRAKKGLGANCRGFRACAPVSTTGGPP